MFGSEILDVAIGLIFIYLLLSLLCSALNELIESWLKSRAVNLERGIRELLGNDPDLVSKLYGHPLVSSLFRGSYSSERVTRGLYRLHRLREWFKSERQRMDLPSYIPARNFATALLDVVAPAGVDQPSGASHSSPGTGAGGQSKSLDDLRERVAAIKNASVRQALLALIDAAGNDAARLRQNLEDWYNSTMERISGWYKRRAQMIILVLGVLVAVVVNADTITIGNSLSHDAASRNSLVAAAQGYSKKEDANDDPVKRVQANLDQIEKFGLPIGWNKQDPRTFPGNSFSGWAFKVVGWLLTAVAVSLGAPFWFDLLNKFITIRSTLKPKEPAADGSSGG